MELLKVNLNSTLILNYAQRSKILWFFLFFFFLATVNYLAFYMSLHLFLLAEIILVKNWQYLSLQFFFCFYLKEVHFIFCWILWEYEDELEKHYHVLTVVINWSHKTPQYFYPCIQCISELPLQKNTWKAWYCDHYPGKPIPVPLTLSVKNHSLITNPILPYSSFILFPRVLLPIT